MLESVSQFDASHTLVSNYHDGSQSLSHSTPNVMMYAVHWLMGIAEASDFADQADCKLQSSEQDYA